MRKLLLIIVFVGAGCNDPICHGPAPSTGPGWCPKAPAPGECVVSMLCAGYCLPDGGDPVNPTPVRCDGGSH